jgi:hypothetical protein
MSPHLLSMRLLPMRLRASLITMLVCLGISTLAVPVLAADEAGSFGAEDYVRAPDWVPGSQWEYSDGYGLKVDSRTQTETLFERLDAEGQWFSRQGFLRKNAVSATATRLSVFRTISPESGYALSATTPLTYRREYQSNGELMSHATSWTVEGRDTITVPAGTFDCWIIVWRTRSTQSDWLGFERWWYSPEVEHYVRLEYQYGEGAVGSRVLTRYQIGNPVSVPNMTQDDYGIGQQSIPNQPSLLPDDVTTQNLTDLMEETEGVAEIGPGGEVDAIHAGPAEGQMASTDPTKLGVSNAITVGSETADANSADANLVNADTEMLNSIAAESAFLNEPAAEPETYTDQIDAQTQMANIAPATPAFASSSRVEMEYSEEIDTQTANIEPTMLAISSPDGFEMERPQASTGMGEPSAAAVFSEKEDGPWYVQIASKQDEMGARLYFAEFRRDAADLVSALPGGVYKADLPDMGIYYRVWFGAFASEAFAEALCGEIISRGAECFVRKSASQSATNMMLRAQALLD